MKHEIVLASGSPRRRELLADIVPEFTVCPAQGEEPALCEQPEKLVRLLAERKAEEVLIRMPEAIVIGADTVVALGNRIFGKPASDDRAREMLRALSGREHSVLTGVCVRMRGFCESWTEESFVKFSPLSEEFIESYLRTGIPADKAGAYGIQCNPSPVESFRGDYDNIVGLPRKRLARVLLKLQGDER